MNKKLFKMIDEVILKLIDESIRDIISDLNELPFLRTLYSCSGDPKTHELKDVPYVDIHYTSHGEGLRFHRSVLSAVPYIDFRILPITTRWNLWRIYLRTLIM